MPAAMPPSAATHAPPGAGRRALQRLARRVGGEGARLERLLQECRRLLSERGEANSLAIAAGLLPRLLALDEDGQRAFFERLATDFGPDPAAVLAAAQRYAEQPDAARLAVLTQVAEPPRQELLRRLNRAPGGTAGIVALRRALLRHLRAQPALAAVEADFLHLLSSWFNAGFLQMQAITWDSPAVLLERLIEHEAVHAIQGWDDLRRRLQPDRRCFAFFHPQLPGEPLIFVEVALLPAMPDAIAPLIDPGASPRPDKDFKVATFYSISNCESGLKGVSLGNFLIKRVAERLQAELPQLRTFCTLSPLPGFAAWLARATAGSLAAAAPVEAAAAPRGRARAAARLTEALATVRAAQARDARALETLVCAEGEPGAADPALHEAMQRLAAHYLADVSVTPAGDPVAKFHLGNGARLERLNPGADRSRKGLQQAHGWMVNYLYDLREVEERHERFVHGEVVAARAIERLR